MQIDLPSRFLKANDNCKDGDIVKILDEGVWSEGDFGQRFNAQVRLPNGDEKTASFNNTSLRNLSEHYGKETSVWVLKDARINIVKQNVRGTMRNVIIFTAPSKDAEGKVVGE